MRKYHYHCLPIIDVFISHENNCNMDVICEAVDRFIDQILANVTLLLFCEENLHKALALKKHKWILNAVSPSSSWFLQYTTLSEFNVHQKTCKCSLLKLGNWQGLISGLIAQLVVHTASNRKVPSSELKTAKQENSIIFAEPYWF